MNEDPTVLLSRAGRELLARLAVDDGRSALAVATSLRREYPVSLVAAATAQHELRLAARAKFVRAMEMLFTRAGYEQSSSETIGRYRAGRFGDARRMADLCCGIGGDLLALASGRDVLAIDLDETHARLALHNAGVYGEAENVRAIVADVRDLTLAGLDGVFIDPARRSGDHRFRAGMSQPPLDWCLALRERVPAVCVKAAPGLPAELIPDDWEAEFIADGRDLKEAVLW
jgi:RNA cap guanine-N2 methyltransferase